MSEFKIYEAIEINSKGEEIRQITSVAKRSIEDAKRFFRENYGHRLYVIRER